MEKNPTLQRVAALTHYLAASASVEPPAPSAERGRPPVSPMGKAKKQAGAAEKAAPPPQPAPPPENAVVVWCVFLAPSCSLERRQRWEIEGDRFKVEISTVSLPVGEAGHIADEERLSRHLIAISTDCF